MDVNVVVCMYVIMYSCLDSYAGLVDRNNTWLDVMHPVAPGISAPCRAEAVRRHWIRGPYAARRSSARYNEPRGSYAAGETEQIISAVQCSPPEGFSSIGREHRGVACGMYLFG